MSEEKKKRVAGNSLKESIYHGDAVKMLLQNSSLRGIEDWIRSQGGHISYETVKAFKENFFKKMTEEELKPFREQAFKDDKSTKKIEDTFRKEGYRFIQGEIPVLQKLINDTDEGIVRLRVKARTIGLFEAEDERALGNHLDRMANLQKRYQELIQDDLILEIKKKLMEKFAAKVSTFIDTKKREEYVEVISEFMVEQGKSL